jgi:hypothetical protein
MSRTAPPAAARAYLSYALAMSEIDDLRRVAYGRPTSPAGEAAASDARVRLSELEARQSALDAEPEAARAEPETPAPPVDEPAARPVTLTFVDTADEPGYLRRLATTWRVWAAPAAAAFIVGIVLTAASSIALLGTSMLDSDEPPVSEGTPPGYVTTDTIAIESGDLDAATSTLARAQEPADEIAGLDGSMDSGSTRLLRSFTGSSAYGATSQLGEICLILTARPGDFWATCAPPTAFPTQGLAIGRVDGDETVRVHWDGSEVVETRVPQ